MVYCIRIPTPQQDWPEPSPVPCSWLHRPNHIRTTGSRPLCAMNSWIAHGWSANRNLGRHLVSATSTSRLRVIREQSAVSGSQTPWYWRKPRKYRRRLTRRSTLPSSCQVSHQFVDRTAEDLLDYPALQLTVNVCSDRQMLRSAVRQWARRTDTL